MSDCNTCVNWVVARVTDYEDGSRIFNYQSADGFGHCDILGIDTEPDFLCNKFKLGTDHIQVSHKTGAPWNHSHQVPCPDCSAVGCDENSRACSRCAGIGKVLLYDDGYLGDEQTRMHPREKELARKPTCMNCGKDVERDWVACPMCGQRLNAAVKTEVIQDINANLPPSPMTEEQGV